MSARDPLEDAIRALRDEGTAPSPQAKLTRERILRDLRPRAKSRRWVWAVPVAALLAGSTVLAATGQLPVIVETAARVFGGAKSDGQKPRTPRAATTQTAAPVTPPLPAAEAPAPSPVAEAPAPSSLEEAPSVEETPKTAAPAPVRQAVRAADGGTRAKPPAAEAPAPSAAAPVPEPATPSTPETDETLHLYRKAHRLHFVDQNPGAALTAWDEYLAKGPRGPLVVDARYDRALCLVRLGRRAEARAALEPFAEGRYGSYRQKEAKALLEALQAP